MRTIKFKVEQQLISRLGDHKNIYTGTENYLELEFEFDDNWKDCVKAIVFNPGPNESSDILKDNKCMVPNDLCQNRFIKFYIVGKRADYRIKTQQARIGVITNG